jgi:hypothetical protein
MKWTRRVVESFDDLDREGEGDYRTKAAGAEPCVTLLSGHPLTARQNICQFDNAI